MSYFFAEGSKFYFSRTFAAAKTLSAITNADPAVATSVSHGYADLDEVLVTSGWEDANNAVLRVDQLTADTFGLTGLDTSDINFFSIGGGAASTTQKISGWLEIPQVLTISDSGGDARLTAVTPLAARNGFNVATGFNPASLTLTMGHDPSLANWKTMLAVSRRLEKVAFKEVLAGGGVTYGYGYLSCSEFAKLNNGQPNSVTAVISFQGRTFAY